MNSKSFNKKFVKDSIVESQLEEPTYGNSRIGSCPLLNINEAAEFTDYKVSTLYVLVHRRMIPHYKRGKRLFFDKAELLAWLTRYKRLSNEELAVEAEKFSNPIRITKNETKTLY